MEIVKFLFALLVATLVGYCFFSSSFMLILDECLKSISYSCFAFVDKDDFNKKYYFNKDDMDNIEVVGYSYEDKIAIIKG